MFSFLRKLFVGQAKGQTVRAGTRGVDELARWLRVDMAELRATVVSYTAFQVPKRTGGTRTLHAPDALLKTLQRRILRRLLGGLRAHPCATGFERGHSIVTNARPHVGQDVVLKLDLQDFFGKTSASRVERYFQTIGWNAEAAALLTRLCTHNGSLPQGAPTSPRLSNLVNFRLDARLARLAEHNGLAYSRYADDLTFSGPARPSRTIKNPKTLFNRGPGPTRSNQIIQAVKRIAADEGYALHITKKLRIARRHDRQVVTGLVVNQKVQLPRKTRRWLRALEHRVATTGQSTLTPEQLAGWRSLAAMVASNLDDQAR
jgi:hypothetical protein